MYKEYDKQLKLLTEAWNTISERHLIESAVVSGEYWIIDGSAVYADGDIGDMNHEAYVIDHLNRIFLDIFDINKDEPLPLSEYENQIGQWFMENGIIQPGTESEESYNNDPANFMLNYLLANHLDKFNNDKQQLTDAFFLAYGSSGRQDARDYGMRHLGWIRVAGNNIQTWTLTSKDMDNISRGINDVLSQENNEDESEINEMTFNVESMSNRKFYVDVPFEVIDSGDVTRLLQYR
jgi:hypothetical protein